MLTGKRHLDLSEAVYYGGCCGWWMSVKIKGEIANWRRCNKRYSLWHPSGNELILWCLWMKNYSFWGWESINGVELCDIFMMWLLWVNGGERMVFRLWYDNFSEMGLSSIDWAIKWPILAIKLWWSDGVTMVVEQWRNYWQYMIYFTNMMVGICS